MRKGLYAALALALVGGFAGSASAQTVVNGDIVVDTTWGAANCPIIMDGVIFVRDGATLTIDQGCVVRGQPRTAAVQAGSTVGTPGALVVTQTGRIDAQGTQVNPIIFTTAATDNDNDGVADGRGVPCPSCADAWNAGDTFLDDTPLAAPLAPLDANGDANVSLWGGVVVLGEAPTNLDDGCGVGKGKCTVEGLTIPGFPVAQATYGGIFPHDSSGILRFISIRHAGDEIGNGNELNGISLGGVGDGTIFENIEVYANFDDGIEWFGGTVNGRNLHVLFAGDDQFDLDQGYTGVNQFMFAVMPFFDETLGDSFGSASGDKGCECDGDDFAEAGGVCVQDETGNCLPFINPNLYNLTILGSSPDVGAAGPLCFTPILGLTGDNRGIQVRNGFAGEILNSIVVNTGTRKGFDSDDDRGDACPGQASLCTGAGAPFACCTGVGEGSCACNAQCTGAAAPFACCTAAGEGECGCFDTVDNIANGSVAVLASTFDDGAALDANECQALANGDADPRTDCGVVGCNIDESGSCGTPTGFGGLVQEDQTFDPQGNADGKLVSTLKTTGCTGANNGAIDARPVFSLGATAPAAGVPAAGTTTVTYRGAFDPGAAAGGTWMAGWTVLSLSDLIAD